MGVIQRAAIVGAGHMGSGIAQAMASHGVDVTLVDRNQELSARAKERIGQGLEKAVARGKLSQADAQAVLSRLHPAGELSAVREVDLVVEAVFEDKTIKQKLFRELGDTCAASTILATNTSSFLVEDLAKVTQHPERVIGLHYFFPAHYNRLVEVVGHDASSPEALRRAWECQERVGKVPIKSADAPGFVVNRFFVPWLNEAVRLYDEGIGIPTIEAVAKRRFGVALGPFELMNATGVAIGMHAANSLGEQLGAFYAAVPGLVRQAESGRPFDLAGTTDPAHIDAVAQRLWGVVYHVVGELLTAKVATPEDVDTGAKVGLRWPKGPLESLRDAPQEGRAWAQAVQQRYQLSEPGYLQGLE